MKTKFSIYSILFLLLLSSCSGSTVEPTATPVDIGAIQTAAVETVIAAVTQTAAAAPTATPAFTETPAPPAPTLTAAITETATPNGTPTENICDKLEFVSDVTVPDGTTMTAGQEFVKTWKVKNIGSCTWTTGYHLVFSYASSPQAQMGGQTTSLTAEVPPNTEAEISITLKAPAQAGTYSSYWILANNNSINFEPRLSVVIVVP